MLAGTAVADQPRFLFGTPSPVAGISQDGREEAAPALSADELEIVFNMEIHGKEKENDFIDLFLARRESVDQPFGEPVPLESINSAMWAWMPSLSHDGQHIYYAGASFDEDLFGIVRATRPTLHEPFGEPTTVVSAPDEGDMVIAPSISSDGLSMYVQHGRARNASDRFDWSIHVATRETTSDAWGELVPVPQFSDPNTYFGRPSISADNLTLFAKTFSDTMNRDRTKDTADLYMLTRPSVDAPWSAPINLGSTINSANHDDEFATLSADGSMLYYTRYERGADGPDWSTTDILQAPVKPFETVTMNGHGGRYSEDFDSMGVDATEPGSPLPRGWTFTANDVVFYDETTGPMPVTSRTWAQVYNAGIEGDTDRALVTEIERNRDEAGELDLRTTIEGEPVGAMRLKFDIEAWRVSGANREAEFQVILEADTGDGFEQVADLGEFSTGPTLQRTSNPGNGNDPAYRASQDTGPINVDIPVGATLRTRWIGTSNSQSVVFGLDNVSMQFASPGDVNVDGLFDSADLVEVFQVNEYEDGIAGNSTWTDGDWNGDGEFDSGDLVVAFQDGNYEAGQRLATVTVPEPKSIVMLILGLLGFVAGRKRQIGQYKGFDRLSEERVETACGRSFQTVDDSVLVRFVEGLRMKYRIFLYVVAICGVSFSDANAQLDERFVPRSETFNGITYEDAVGDFMEWWFAFPSDNGNNVHPLLDADGSEMHINNDGPIYNLNVSWRKGNTLPASERDPIGLQEIRRIEVRSDQAIFAPLAGWIGWPLPTSNANVRDPVQTQSDLNDLFDDTAFDMRLSINGDKIEIDQSADSPFLIDTVHFDIPFPSDSAFNDVEGYQADDPDHSSRYSTPNVLPFVVSNNYMSLLKPLPVGEHTVELFGRNTVDGEVAFTTDIAYQITVTQAGDFNENGILDLEDINLLSTETAAATHNVDYDVTFDSKVDGGRSIDLGQRSCKHLDWRFQPRWRIQ